MKNKLASITSLFLIIPIISSSQSFSLQELISLTSKDIDGFDTYVTTKGYKYQNTKNEENFEGVTYALNQSIYSKKATKFITLYTKYISNNTKCVVFQTLVSSDYLLIKNQIKINGFKFIRTENHENVSFLIYSKENFELSLASGQEENGQFVTGYEISLKKFSY